MPAYYPDEQSQKAGNYSSPASASSGFLKISEILNGNLTKKDEIALAGLLKNYENSSDSCPQKIQNLQIAYSLLNVKNKSSTLLPSIANALAGQINYLSQSEQFTSADKKLQILFEMNPKIVNSSKIVYTAVENAIFDQFLFMKSMEKFASDSTYISNLLDNYHYSPAKSTSVSAGSYKYDTVGDTIYKNSTLDYVGVGGQPSNSALEKLWHENKISQKVQMYELPDDLAVRSHAYLESIEQLCTDMKKTTNNSTILELINSIETAAKARKLAITPLTKITDPEQKERIISLLYDFKTTYNTAMKKIENEKYFDELYSAAGNNLIYNMIVSAKKHSQLGVYATGAAIGVMCPPLAFMPWLTLGGKEAIMGAANSDARRTITGLFMIGAMFPGAIGKISSGAIAADIGASSVQIVRDAMSTSFTPTDIEALAANSVLLFGIGNSRISKTQFSKGVKDYFTKKLEATEKFAKDYVAKKTAKHAAKREYTNLEKLQNALLQNPNSDVKKAAEKDKDGINSLLYICAQSMNSAQISQFQAYLKSIANSTELGAHNMLAVASKIRNNISPKKSAVPEQNFGVYNPIPNIGKSIGGVAYNPGKIRAYKDGKFVDIDMESSSTLVSSDINMKDIMHKHLHDIKNTVSSLHNICGVVQMTSKEYGETKIADKFEKLDKTSTYFENEITANYRKLLGSDLSKSKTRETISQIRYQMQKSLEFSQNTLMPALKEIYEDLSMNDEIRTYCKNFYDHLETMYSQKILKLSNTLPEGYNGSLYLVSTKKTDPNSIISSSPDFLTSPISLNIIPGPDVYANADAVLLQEAFKNVVSNASDFASSNVEISYYKSRNNLHILVANDTKTGIPESDVLNLFNPNIKKSNSKSKSTLFGLAMAKKSMKAMGGDIFLVDAGRESGKTMFELTIPVWKESAANDKTDSQKEFPKSNWMSAFDKNPNFKYTQYDKLGTLPREKKPISIFQDEIASKYGAPVFGQGIGGKAFSGEKPKFISSPQGYFDRKVEPITSLDMAYIYKLSGIEMTGLLTPILTSMQNVQSLTTTIPKVSEFGLQLSVLNNSSAEVSVQTTNMLRILSDLSTTNNPHIIDILSNPEQGLPIDIPHILDINNKIILGYESTISALKEISSAISSDPSKMADPKMRQVLILSAGMAEELGNIQTYIKLNFAPMVSFASYLSTRQKPNLELLDISDIVYSAMQESHLPGSRSLGHGFNVQTDAGFAYYMINSAIKNSMVNQSKEVTVRVLALNDYIVVRVNGENSISKNEWENAKSKNYNPRSLAENFCDGPSFRTAFAVSKVMDVPFGPLFEPGKNTTSTIEIWFRKATPAQQTNSPPSQVQSNQEIILAPSVEESSQTQIQYRKILYIPNGELNKIYSPYSPKGKNFDKKK
ncbi:MAG: ATP-binding protein [Candidatus Micrarchaeia archaeon]